MIRAAFGAFAEGPLSGGSGRFTCNDYAVPMDLVQTGKSKRLVALNRYSNRNSAIASMTLWLRRP